VRRRIAERTRVFPATPRTVVSTNFYKLEGRVPEVNPLRREPSGGDRRSNAVRSGVPDVLVSTLIRLRQQHRYGRSLTKRSDLDARQHSREVPHL
jgi:hypothetical protein